MNGVQVGGIILDRAAALNERDDPPGNLIRSGCARVLVADMIAELRRLRAVEADRDAFARFIADRVTSPRDHACVECVPSGDIIIPGFRCSVHRARAIVATLDAPVTP